MIKLKMKRAWLRLCKPICLLGILICSTPFLVVIVTVCYASTQFIMGQNLSEILFELVQIFGEIPLSKEILASTAFMCIMEVLLIWLYVGKLRPGLKEIESVISAIKQGNYSSYSSYSGSFSGTASSFDARRYVDSHCTAHRYGTKSDRDIAIIENDSSLTYGEKEAAKEAYDRLSIIHY